MATFFFNVLHVNVSLLFIIQCLEEVMDALTAISSTVSLLEQKFSLSIERRLGEAVEGIKVLQQKQEPLESQFELFQSEYMKKHSVSTTPAQPSRVRTISSSTTPAQPFQQNHYGRVNLT